MKKAIIMDEEEISELSLFIAERVLDLSEKFYGFTMHSRQTGKELGKDVMSDILIIAIEDAMLDKLILSIREEIIHKEVVK